MAIRNYVGARYVPKFADPVEWQANTSYEAMVIVTYNNSSYTSKIPVPPTVGNPAENSKYWALTGNYNAQVEEYRKAASDAQERAKDGICANDEGNNTNASKSYTAKEYLWWHGKLYRVTDDMLEGDRLVAGNNVTEANIADGVNINWTYINLLSRALGEKIKYKVYTTVRETDSSNNIDTFGFMFDPAFASHIVEVVPDGVTLIPIHAQYHYFKTDDEFNDSNNTGDTLMKGTIWIEPGVTRGSHTSYVVHVSSPTTWSQVGYYCTVGVLEIRR